MDESVALTDFVINNFAPESDSITIENPDWGITIWRSENQEVHVLIEDNKDSTQVDLVLGKNGFTQRC
jgi:hypothetical protein